MGQTQADADALPRLLRPATVFADTSASIAAAVPPPPGTPVRYTTNWAYDRLDRLVGTVWDNAAAAGTLPASGGVTFTHAYNAANLGVGQRDGSLFGGLLHAALPPPEARG